MSNYNAILKDAFEQTTSEELLQIQLMDRVESKFAFTLSELPILLDRLSAYYRVVKINDGYIATYKTLYFDTNNFDMYLKHHNGHLNRYKIRLRSYLDSDTTFLEVKFKSNKGRTLKKRIQHPLISPEFNEVEKQFLFKNSPYHSDYLTQKACINYQRITLIGKDTNERVTIDMNIEFKNDYVIKKLDQLIIAEIKQSQKKSTPAVKLFKEFKIKEQTVSKYCLAVTQLYPYLKQNNFKKNLTELIIKINDKSFNLAPGF